MQIKTLKPDLLIGTECHPLGAAVEVNDIVGHRLINAKAAVQTFAVADLMETATLPPAPNRAVKRA